MDTRREFLKKAILLSGASGFSGMVPASIQRAFAIDPAAGSTYLDAEHIVILMQENRSFDHCFGTLQGVRGFSDPRAVILPDKKPVWLQTNEKGETYSPFRLNIKDTRVTWMGDLPHSRASQVDAYNKGKYDKWLVAKKSGNPQYNAMPLTLGYYNRVDLPFHYALADAFTICDQNFCSAMTSTTPNRSFFWTGNIMAEQDGLTKAHIRNTDFSYGSQTWKAFPELLEDNGIPWKFYQNDLSSGGGYKGEERSWLANYGCNLLEFFAAYNVKFASRYVQNLRLQVETLPGEIDKLKAESPSSDDAARKINIEIAKKQEVLDKARVELLKWSKENFEKLPDREKKLFTNAFVLNSGDKSYRSIATLKYNDGGKEREVTVPEGDVLFQFRQDVNSGKLPMVSWLAAPQNFSDHPSAPWYGAWYVSEIMDILTKNPEVWKKTIFITTYDENDGYFDHVVPFSIPDKNIPGTGKVSKNIETEVEHVRLENELKQGIPKNQAREAPVGLGFRVPMIIASPWSRGGKVCSQVFEHTSTLQFLESFINKKLHKNLRLENISEWRRTISGDLTSAFSPYVGRKLESMPFLNRDRFVEAINNAKFKELPSGYKKISEEEINRIVQLSSTGNVLSDQEKGIRPSCGLPYELYADGKWNPVSKSFELQMKCGKEVFGDRSAGSPFTVCAPVNFKDEKGEADLFRNWSFAVAAGDTIEYNWPLHAFENNRYHLRLNGPNGFYREFMGNGHDPAAGISVEYEKNAKSGKLTGNILLRVVNHDQQTSCSVSIIDNAYKTKSIIKEIPGKATTTLVIKLDKSFGWYDFSARIKGFDDFEKRYAGRVETGRESFSDPYMGRNVPAV